MDKYYLVGVETLKAIAAESEEEALKDAKNEFIEAIKNGHVEFIIVEELEE